MNIDRVLDRLDRVKKSGKGWMACCPSHDDRSASLAVTEADNKILFNCFAGCTFNEICGALGFEEKEMFAEEYQPLEANGFYFTKKHLDDIDTKIWLVAQGHADIENGCITEKEVVLWRKTISKLAEVSPKLLKEGHKDVCRRIKVAITYKTSIQQAG
jgi:hypothetical protein